MRSASKLDGSQSQQAKKKPGEAGLTDEFQFYSVYFASFAIWCVSRETFRLALFL